MAQKNIFIQSEGGPSTFHFDESLDNLPLPSLDDTLQTYFKSLIPFASDESELKNTERIINEFKNGNGKKLHKMLQEKASKEKNWVFCLSYSWFIESTALDKLTNSNFRLKNIGRIMLI